MKKIIILLGAFLLSACASHAPLDTTQTTSTEVPSKTVQALTEYDNKAYERYVLVVSLQGGRVNFNNIDGYAAFTPVRFILKNNETRAIEIVKAGDNFFHSKILLMAHYENGILLLDTNVDPYAVRPSTGMARELQFNSHWLEQERYDNISTQGEASLDQVSVIVQLTAEGK